MPCLVVTTWSKAWLMKFSGARTWIFWEHQNYIDSLQIWAAISIYGVSKSLLKQQYSKKLSSRCRFLDQVNSIITDLLFGADGCQNTHSLNHVPSHELVSLNLWLTKHGFGFVKSLWHLTGTSVLLMRRLHSTWRHGNLTLSHSFLGSTREIRWWND